MLVPNIAVKTDFGLKRQIKGDNSLVYSYPTGNGIGTLLVVAHGLGAFGYGEKSSLLVVNTIYEEIKAIVEQSPSDLLESSENALKKSLRKAVEESDEALNNYFEDTHRKGVTVACVFIWNNSVAIANVGDNRVYLYRGSELKQITEDHTLATAMAKRNYEEQLEDWKFTLYNSLGSRNQLQIDLFTLTLETNDQLLLCSSGLGRQLDNAEIAETLSHSTTPEQAIDQLISTANEKGGLYNVTAAMCKMIEGQPNLTPILKRGEAKFHPPLPTQPKKAVAIPIHHFEPAEVNEWEFYFQTCVRRTTINPIAHETLTKSYDLTQPDEGIKHQLIAKVKEGMASPHETGVYEISIEQGFNEAAALQSVEIEGLVALVFLGEKEIIPDLLALVKSDRSKNVKRQIVATMAIRYLTGQTIEKEFSLKEELFFWERWWEQNKGAFIGGI